MGTFVSLFAGVGGFDLGLEQSGHTCVGQVEIDKKCLAVLEKHWPDVPKHNDVVTAKEWADEYGLVGKVDIISGGFPCFPAGTLILTKDGWLPIEGVEVGTLVLTHTGSWKPVIQTMNRVADETYILKGHGIPNITTTREHPMYTRKRTRKWDKKLRGYKSSFSDPAWVDAGDSCGLHAGQVLPEVDAEVDAEWTEDFWWVIGRYLADGWTTTGKLGKKDSRAVICCSHEEADYLEERLKSAGIHATRAEDRTATKFIITRKWFVEFIKPLGKYAYGKTLTSRELSLGVENATELLAGYLSGDGNRTKQGWQATTVSRALALSMALLAQRAYGVVAAVHKTEMPKTCVIEGRTVNQRDQYKIVIPEKNRSAFVEGDYGWKLIKNVKRVEGDVRVYNIGVQEDESYIADGSIVHNCQDVSVAGKRAGLAGARTGLFFDALAFATHVKAKTLILENVPGLLSSNQGRDFGVVLTSLADAGYSNIEWRVLDSQFFGVPQRRRRVFIVASAANQRFPEVLVEREGSIGDSSSSGTPGQAATGSSSSSSAEGGPGSGSSEFERVGNFELFTFPEEPVSPALSAQRAEDMINYQTNA